MFPRRALASVRKDVRFLTHCNIVSYCPSRFPSCPDCVQCDVTTYAVLLPAVRFICFFLSASRRTTGVRTTVDSQVCTSCRFDNVTLRNETRQYVLRSKILFHTYTYGTRFTIIIAVRTRYFERNLITDRRTRIHRDVDEAIVRESARRNRSIDVSDYDVSAVTNRNRNRVANGRLSAYRYYCRWRRSNRG